MEPTTSPGSAADLPPFVAEKLRTTSRRTFAPEWPNSAKCVASLSVHVDAQTVWGALGMQNLMYTSLGEFGPRVGVWRFLELLGRLGLKASFFIPAWVVESYPDVAREVVGAGHEIGQHGYDHTMKDLGWAGDHWDRAQEVEVLDRSKRIIEDTTGHTPRGFISPAGIFSPYTIDLLLEKGYQYHNTCSADDIPYWWYKGGKATPLLELPFDWVLSDSTCYLHTLIPWMGEVRTPDQAYDLWKAEFDGAYRYGRCFLLTNHPQWSGRASRIMGLEKLLEYIRGHSDVWWATSGEIADYWRRRYPPESFKPE